MATPIPAVVSENMPTKTNISVQPMPCVNAQISAAIEPGIMRPNAM